MIRVIPLAAFALACTEYDIGQPEVPEVVTEPVTLPTEPAPEPEPDEPPPDPPPATTPPPPVTDGETPIAVCYVDPSEVSPPFEVATFYGSDSYDPDGTIVTYSWTIIAQPPGSAIALPPGNAPDRGPFAPDLAGTYTARLVVTDDMGNVSAPCDASLEALPSQDLWVELYWSHNNDDMDLHVVREGGALWNNTDDCHWQNCKNGVAWGVSGKTDDPELDLDDLTGKGPENINLAKPAESEYTVVVHDYGGANVWNGDNDVTVNIYISGSLEYSETKVISGDDDEVPFAKIDWDALTVIPL